MSSESRLKIVDGEGNILGEATREEIHRKGLLHREVHVWLVTPKNEIIFQRRSKSAETYPNLLDATAGGHVEIGQTFEEGALTELEEETGVKLGMEKLQYITTVHRCSRDEVTGRINNALRKVYASLYQGKIENFKIEKNNGLGFEAWPLARLFGLSDSEKSRFIPYMISPEHLKILETIVHILPAAIL